MNIFPSQKKKKKKKLVVRQASQRLRLIQAQKHGILTPGASVYRPRLLPLPGSDQTSAQVLQELESRWTASLQASPSGRDCLSSDLPDSQPAWMAPSRGHRQHWSERQQQQRAQQQQPAQQPQQLPSDRDANNDTMDVLGDPGDPPQLTEWRRLWQLAGAAYLDRQHRVLWWRILHGCVMCGAFSAYIGRATLQQACCPFACCCTPTQPQTISHMFLGCPVAATVVSWLCRLWQAMTGHTPDASVATILAASTPDGHCASDALLQTWHRLSLQSLLAQNLLWSSKGLCLMRSHCWRQTSLFLAASSCPRLWGHLLRWLGFNLHQGQMLGAWGMLHLLLPHPMLGCLRQLLPWLAREGALSLYQAVSLLRLQRLRLLIV